MFTNEKEDHAHPGEALREVKISIFNIEKKYWQQLKRVRAQIANSKSATAKTKYHECEFWF